MSILMTLALLGYGAVTALAMRSVYQRMCGGQDSLLNETATAYERLLKEQEYLREQREKYDQEASDIFTLYELTREINRSFDEQEAFMAFQQKLRETVDYSNSRLLPPLTDSKTIQPDRPDTLCLPLRGKKRLLGYLWLEGIKPEHNEKVLILSRQLGLALRRIRLYQELEYLAIMDGLTGVYARRHIMERFQEEMNRAQSRKTPLSVLMIDVDFFKHINDHYGHLTGDQVLRVVADTICESIREIDVAGRFGGEEFFVILPETDRSGAHYVAERIRTAMEEKAVAVYDATIRVAVSIGAATFPDDARAAHELLDKADWAMYRAKKSGRNRTCSYGVYASSTYPESSPEKD